MAHDGSNPFLPVAGHPIPAGRIAGRDLVGTPHDLPRPADGTNLGQVGWAQAADVEPAVSAAVGAGDQWSATSPRERGHALRAIAAELRKHTAELAEINCLESGKRLAEATGEVDFSAQYFEWFAEAGAYPRDEHYAIAARRFIVQRRPVGVVAAVSPWNFPLSIPARKIAPALAAGCPVVQKPSELTPLSSMALTRLAEPFLPAGLLGLLIGDGAELTSTLVDHPDVAAITFTGSTQVGTRVAARAMESMTRVTMELGGKSPFIICADADVGQAVETLMIAKFRNNGASCIAANNVFVHESHYAAVRDALGDRIRDMTVGDPADPATDLGPMLRPAYVDRLTDLVAEADAASCRVVRGDTGPDEGWYSAPTLVEAAPGLRLWREEIFGPICAIRSFSDEDAVVSEVRSWRTGLGGYLMCTDGEHAATLASRLPIGLIGINNGAPNTPRCRSAGSASPASAARAAPADSWSSPRNRRSPTFADPAPQRPSRGVEVVVTVIVLDLPNSAIRSPAIERTCSSSTPTPRCG